METVLPGLGRVGVGSGAGKGQGEGRRTARPGRGEECRDTKCYKSEQQEVCRAWDGREPESCQRVERLPAAYVQYVCVQYHCPLPYRAPWLSQHGNSPCTVLYCTASQSESHRTGARAPIASAEDRRRQF